MTASTAARPGLAMTCSTSRHLTPTTPTTPGSPETEIVYGTAQPSAAAPGVHNSRQVPHRIRGTPDQHHSITVTALNHLPAALHQPRIRTVFRSNPNQFPLRRGKRTAVKVPELRRSDMEHGTRSPEVNQRLIPAVRTVAKDAGEEADLCPLLETPGLLPGLSPLITPTQRTADNEFKQHTQHTPPPTTPTLQRSIQTDTTAKRTRPQGGVRDTNTPSATDLNRWLFSGVPLRPAGCGVFGYRRRHDRARPCSGVRSTRNTSVSQAS